MSAAQTPSSGRRIRSKGTPYADDPARPLRVLQFTDCHLYADGNTTLLGVNTLESFRSCLDLARRQHWPPDLVVVTGDLVHDESEAGYRTLNQMLNELGSTTAVIPGNHDDRDRMRSCLTGDAIVTQSSLAIGQWQVVLLDSSIDGSEGGRLADDQLELLDHALEHHPEHHSLICLHHQPVPVGSHWMDTMRLDNPEPFFAILRRHPNTRVVLWGHVHQTFEQFRDGLWLLATPSTCIQFTPGSETFSLDPKPPGYRWLELHADGRIDTGVERLSELPAGVDFDSHGY